MAAAMAIMLSRCADRKVICFSTVILYCHNAYYSSIIFRHFNLMDIVLNVIYGVDWLFCDCMIY